MLSIPVKDAVNTLTHEICEFLSGPTGHLQTICIAIMPNYAPSEEVSYLYNIHTQCNEVYCRNVFSKPYFGNTLQMFQTVRRNLSAKMVDNAGQCKRFNNYISHYLSLVILTQSQMIKSAHAHKGFVVALGNPTVSNMSSFTVTTALFQSLTSDLDEIIMAVDGIELHLVFGDITNETTDAIVNTTDFKDFQTAGIHVDL